MAGSGPMVCKFAECAFRTTTTGEAVDKQDQFQGSVVWIQARCVTASYHPRICVGALLRRATPVAQVAGTSNRARDLGVAVIVDIA